MAAIADKNRLEAAMGPARSALRPISRHDFQTYSDLRAGCEHAKYSLTMASKRRVSKYTGLYLSIAGKKLKCLATRHSSFLGWVHATGEHVKEPSSDWRRKAETTLILTNLTK